MKKRNGNLDFLKFLFAVMIVLFHGKKFAVNESYIFPGGSMAVEFFFIVSGYLMAKAALKKELNGSIAEDTICFMKHKIEGLMPNYYVAFVIAFIVMHLNARNWMSVVKDMPKAIWELLLITGVGLRNAGSINNGPIWYLSAMLLVMFVIWPIMRKFRSSFFAIIAPLSTLLLLGITYQQWKSFGGPSIWLNFCLKGTIRAFMSILLGCVVFQVAEFLKKVEFTNVSRILFSFVEFIGYSFIFVYSFYCGRSRYDWLELIVLALCITLTMSNVSFWSQCFQHPIFNWLGVYSYSLYLGHGFWANSMASLFPDMTYWQRMPIYLLLAFATGLFIHFVSVGLRKFWSKNAQKVRTIFVVDHVAE